MLNKDRFKAHDEWQEKLMDIIRPFTDDKHLPDIRISINNVLFSIDFKTTRNVEDSSHNTYFKLLHNGEKVAIVYNDRNYAGAEDGEPLAGWIDKLIWTGPIPPSARSRSGDPYYKISGGIPLVEFLKSIKENTND